MPITDPIIAAIAKHREAAAALLKACDHKASLEEKLGGGRFYDGDDPQWIAAKKAEGAAYRASERAALRLLTVQPRTKAGVVALLAHYAEIGRREVPPVSSRAQKKLGAPFAVILASNAAAALMNVECAS
jgi:hypothetical protein